MRTWEKIGKKWINTGPLDLTITKDKRAKPYFTNNCSLTATAGVTSIATAIYHPTRQVAEYITGGRIEDPENKRHQMNMNDWWDRYRNKARPPKGYPKAICNDNQAEFNQGIFAYLWRYARKHSLSNRKAMGALKFSYRNLKVSNRDADSKVDVSMRRFLTRHTPYANKSSDAILIVVLHGGHYFVVYRPIWSKNPDDIRVYDYQAHHAELFNDPSSNPFSEETSVQKTRGTGSIFNVWGIWVRSNYHPVIDVQEPTKVGCRRCIRSGRQLTWDTTAWLATGNA